MLLSKGDLCDFRIFAENSHVAYARLPRALWEESQCSCREETCYWDTLVIPKTAGSYSWRVHCPPEREQALAEYVAEKAAQAAAATA